LHAKAERAILYEVRSARLSLWVGILERGLLRLNSSNSAVLIHGLRNLEVRYPHAGFRRATSPAAMASGVTTG